MQIETYEIEEADAGTTPEIETEAIKLIDALGLDGQRSLVNKPDGVTEKRFQYPEMTAQEITVYRALFPQHTLIKAYASGIIPVRVLQVAAHALDFCNYVQVWHKQVRDPDPILVGLMGQHEYAPTKRFLLARWGDGLKPFATLIEEARTVIRTKFKAGLENTIVTAQGNLSRLDSLVETELSGQPTYVNF